MIGVSVSGFSVIDVRKDTVENGLVIPVGITVLQVARRLSICKIVNVTQRGIYTVLMTVPLLRVGVSFVLAGLRLSAL